MKSLTLAAFLCLSAGPVAAAEAWNCQFPGHGGIWQRDGNELVAPPASGQTRFGIVRESSDAIVALSDEFNGRHFELVTLDRRRLAIRILLLDLDGGGEQREVGSCTIPDTRAVAGARAAVGRVRSGVRSLVNQARSLADQGFITAAHLKLTEAEATDRIRPEESQLIGQMRQYIAAKPRK